MSRKKQKLSPNSFLTFSHKQLRSNYHLIQRHPHDNVHLMHFLQTMPILASRNTRIASQGVVTCKGLCGLEIFY
ncbi:hypothetical protein VNO77_35428 [Canavalia gladiata]|uniref:Uncharacterized protein n=1 Tax=Canavalia gladiata TaxID=3824 RepID=A0AAN9KF56_CANGL